MTSRLLPTQSRLTDPTHKLTKLSLQLLLCMGLALGRPQWGELEVTERWAGEDVVFALDCSKSMLAT